MEIVSRKLFYTELSNCVKVFGVAKDDCGIACFIYPENECPLEIRYYPTIDIILFDVEKNGNYSIETNKDNINMVQGMYEYGRYYRPNNDDVFRILEKLLDDKFNLLLT